MRLEEAVDLTVADVMHSRFSVLPADASVADVQEWFAGSASHRMALLADDGRYVACLVPADLDGTDDAGRAAEHAREWPTVTPDEPAKRGEELALSTDARRIPVVSRDGRLLGIVAITTDLQGFCGT
jgi:CBS-domain-containing membrane protein